jgi:membrane protease YdiL (CAAX protease family)
MNELDGEVLGQAVQTSATDADNAEGVATSVGGQCSRGNANVYGVVRCLFLFVIAGMVPLGIAPFIINANEMSSRSGIMLLIFVQTFLQSTIVVVAYRLYRSPMPYTPIFGFSRATQMAFTPVLMLSAFIVGILYRFVAFKALGISLDDLSGKDLPTSPIEWQIVVLIVQPAIFEELFFRDILLGNLRTRFGIKAALIVSSLLFAVCHVGAPIVWPSLFVVGFALGVVRLTSGTIILPILLHAFNNALALALAAGAGFH